MSGSEFLVPVINADNRLLPSTTSLNPTFRRGASGWIDERLDQKICELRVYGQDPEALLSSQNRVSNLPHVSPQRVMNGIVRGS